MTPIDPTLRIRSVHLAVSDLARSADFYERALGLPLLAREPEEAWLGTDPDAPALHLRALADPTPTPVGATGLFHVAWLHSTRAALAETLRRVSRTGWRFEGASDHGVSEALYLSDPDGLGIELYVDRPREQWQRPPDGRGVTMVTLPLDIEDLLAQSTDEPGDTLAPGTGIGHVHLKVTDVERAASFYRDALGMDEQARLPSAAFLSAGGYHHHIGLNSWQSEGAGPAPDSAPGLRLVEFELADPAALDGLAANLASSSEGEPTKRDDGSLLLGDPDGVALAFAAAP
jgi:catechol 2,3-dioxygenase